MKRAETKSNRLLQIEALLLAHPEGLTQAQIANRLGVHRSTVLRNLADIQAPIFESNGRYFIDREAYLVNLRLTLHEAFSMHLAGRLMATRIDRENPHAAAALRKLGLALEILAPQISRFIRGSADLFDNNTKRQDPHYLQVLEQLTLAWAEQRKVRLWYRGAENGPVKTYLFCPYFIEISAVGQTIYAIGRIEPANESRTFRIERIERLELLGEVYSIPDGFDPDELFSSAWGIWFTNQEPVDVVLQFSQRVARRVGETRWHRSEQVVEQADGSLLWHAQIAEPQEMMPWIRGWGADVMVIAPQKLRETMRQEAERLYMLYQAGGDGQPPLPKGEAA